MRDQPARFLNPRGKGEMLAAQGAAERARHEDRIPNLRAAAQRDSRFLDLADQRDHDELFVADVGRVAADDLAAERLRGGLKAGVELLSPNARRYRGAIRC